MIYQFALFCILIIISFEANTKTSSSKSSKLSPQQIKKTVCMSLSRMHIEQHMDSIEQALDSEDQQRTLKLASLLDKSFRKCLKHINPDHLVQLQSVYSMVDYNPQKQIEQVFGNVEYQKDGQLIIPLSVQQTRQSRNQYKSGIQQISSEVKSKSEKKYQPPKSNVKTRKNKQPPKVVQLQQEHSNYEFSQQYPSIQQYHSREQHSAQSYHSQQQHKQPNVAEPEQDVHVQLEIPLQDSQKSFLVYFYPLILIFGVLGYCGFNFYKNYKQRKVILKNSNWDDIIESQQELFEQMMQNTFEKVALKTDEILIRQKDKSRRRILLKTYIKYLTEKHKQIQQEENRHTCKQNKQTTYLKDLKTKIKHQLKRVDFRLAHEPFCKNNNYDNNALLALMQNYEELISKIDDMPIEIQQKKEVMLMLFPYTKDSVKHYINQQLEKSVQPKQIFLDKFIFEKDAIDKRRQVAKIIELQIFKRIRYINAVVDILAVKFGNIKLAQRFVEQMLGSQYSVEEGKILFYLKMTSIFLYKQKFVNMSYTTVKNMTVSQIFHQYLKQQQYKNFEQLKPIFDILKKTRGDNVQYIQKHYAFTEQCSFQQMIKLFHLKFLRIYHGTAGALIQRIRSHKGQTGIFYSQIRKILSPYRKNSEVQQMLKVLKYCEIFNSYGINRSYFEIQQLMINMTLPQNLMQKQYDPVDKIKRIHHQLVLNFCKYKYKTHKLSLEKGQYLDLSNPISLFKCICYLRKQKIDVAKLNKNSPQELNKDEIKIAIFQKHIGSYQLFKIVYKYIFKYSHNRQVIVGVLNIKILQEYGIIPQIIKSAFEEYLEQTLVKCNNYSEIQGYIDEIISILKSSSKQWQQIQAQELLESLDDPKLKLIRYLYDKIRVFSPSEILKKSTQQILQWSFSYSSIDQKTLYNILKQIQSLPDTIQQNKDWFTKYQASKAKHLLKNGRDKEGIQIIKKMKINPPTWFCVFLLEVMDKFPRTDKQLLETAYINAYTGSQLQRIRQKYYQFNRTYENKVDNKNKLICEGLIKDQNKYTELINTKRQSIFSQQKYTTFLFLLGTEHQQAFYYAYRKQLDFATITKFIDQFKKIMIKQNKQICNHWMQRFIVYSLHRKYISPDNFVPFSIFSLKHQDNLSNSLNIHNIFKQLTSNKQIVNKINLKVELSTLTNYYWDNRYNQFKYGESKNINILKQVEEKCLINVVQRIVITVCEQLDNANLNDNFDDNFCRNILQLIRLNNKIFSDSLFKMMNSLKKLQERAKLARKLINQQQKLLDIEQGLKIEQDNLAIIESLSRLEQIGNKQFVNLIPISFFYTPIQQDITIKLPNQQIDILRKTIKPQNVFIIAKSLYFVYGMNKSIEQSIYRMFYDKFQEEKEVIKKFESTKKSFKQLQ